MKRVETSCVFFFCENIQSKTKTSPLHSTKRAEGWRSFQAIYHPPAQSRRLLRLLYKCHLLKLWLFVLLKPAENPFRESAPIMAATVGQMRSSQVCCEAIQLHGPHDSTIHGSLGGPLSFHSLFPRDGLSQSSPWFRWKINPSGSLYLLFIRSAFP